MEYKEENNILSKLDVINIYIKYISGKTVRFYTTVWWWNLSYGIKKDGEK